MKLSAKQFFTAVTVLPFLLLANHVYSQQRDQNISLDSLVDSVENKVIKWRRHFHQFPELSNREFKTAKTVAAHLRSLGLEVKTGIAHTGVVGILRGGLPGKVVALRADMDALPVTERVDLPFASTQVAEYAGQKVGVMHACGHDTHTAILMGVAEVLSKIRDKIPGTVKFIFQPAEEGVPVGEEGGAELMVKEGVLKNPDVSAIFGLHISSQTRVGTIGYRPGGMMASVDDFRILVKGQQTHGSAPWNGVDPIVISSQIINSLQTIVSRQMQLTKQAAVVTIGSIHGGVRSNIIPEEVEMIGTIRALDADMREKIHQKVRQIATGVAESMGASVKIDLPMSSSYPVTYNTPELVKQMLPTMKRQAGEGRVVLIDAITGAEDFSFFAKEVPGFYFFLGGRPVDVPPEKAPAHHTPDFYIDESGMKLGVQTLANMALDYLQN
ncbi:amidohydrolase [Aliikangiella coralliicola]|uniref:Amidohydrolase n=1 Tax=Aliikangiella coralliicola TaxID=2592383 RepID=A0A545UI53_9GAMM|nr:amidohydrolase [Aliikangiella coralliicola]TQV89142.1 amidohydrolase [Aliikangiella coralliicola]